MRLDRTLGVAAVGFLAAIASAQPTSGDRLTLPPVGLRDCPMGQADPTYTSNAHWGSREWLDWAAVSNYATSLYNIFARGAEDLQVRLERARCHQQMTATKTNFLTSAPPTLDRCRRGSPSPPYDGPRSLVQGTGFPDAAAVFNQTVFDFRRRAKALDDLKTRVETMRCEGEAIAVQLRAIRRLGQGVSLAPARVLECQAAAENSYVTPSYTYSSVAGNRDYGIILTSYSARRKETLEHMTDLQARIEEVRCMQSVAKETLKPMLRHPHEYVLAVRGQPTIQGEAVRTSTEDDALRPRGHEPDSQLLERSQEFPNIEARPQPPDARCTLTPANPSYYTASLEQRFSGGREDPWQSEVPNKMTEGAAEFVQALDDLQSRATRLQCEQEGINAKLDFLIDPPQ